VNAPTLIPDLFGRFTAILKEHDHLRTTLARLREMCGAIESGAPSFGDEASPGRLLEELRADLTAHFAAEQSKEYFGVVVDEAPALAPRIAALETEHASILVAAETLALLAAEPGRWRELPALTRALIGELERHERSESALLRQLFSAT